MATTTNFGWETPDDTDLVKDGAAAIRTLGAAIDTSFVDLKGGTTGQMLTKASNTDLDYSWITPQIGDITAVTAGIGISGGGTTGDVTITNSMATAIDAKGDLIAGTGADAFSRLAVGTDGQILTADSTTATGLKWATQVSTQKILQVVVANLNSTASTSSTSYADTGLSVTITPSSASNTILIHATIPMGMKQDTYGGFLTLTNGTTNLLSPTSPGSRTIGFTRFEGQDQYSMRSNSIIFQHSPASTSAQTYKIRFKVNNASSTAYINRMGTDADAADYVAGVATIVAYEVAA